MGNLKWRFHNPLSILISILQPILWLVLYSSVAGQNMHGSGIENYTAFIFPVLVVPVVVSACGSSGMMNYMMKSEGSFYRILISPINRNAIILGHLFESILTTFFEIGIMAIIGRLMFSVKIFNGITSVFIISILIFLTAFFMVGVAYSISLILPNEMLYETIMNAIVLPIFFLSPALFPVDKINGILKVIINLNPFTHIINSLRSVILSGVINTSEIYFSVILLLMLSVFSYIIAYSRLKKQMSL